MFRFVQKHAEDFLYLFKLKETSQEVQVYGLWVPFLRLEHIDISPSTDVVIIVKISISLGYMLW